MQWEDAAAHAKQTSEIKSLYFKNGLFFLFWAFLPFLPSVHQKTHGQVCSHACSSLCHPQNSHRATLANVKQPEDLALWAAEFESCTVHGSAGLEYQAQDF